MMWIKKQEVEEIKIHIIYLSFASDFRPLA
mgnify:CR=1 FL=1